MNELNLLANLLARLTQTILNLEAVVEKQNLEIATLKKGEVEKADRPTPKRKTIRAGKEAIK